MPKLSIEATIGLMFEVLLTILDHLHVREPLIIWGLFVVGVLLIGDSIVRGEWATKLTDDKTRRNRRALWGLLSLAAFVVFGFWVYGRLHPEPSSVAPDVRKDNPHIRMMLVIDSIGKKDVSFHLEPEAVNCTISNVKASFETSGKTGMVERELQPPFSRTLSPGDKMSIAGPLFTVQPRSWNRVNVELAYDVLSDNATTRFKSLFQFFFLADSARSIAPEGINPPEIIAANAEAISAGQDIVSALGLSSGTIFFVIPDRVDGKPNFVHARGINREGVAREFVFDPNRNLAQFSIKRIDGRIEGVRSHLQQRENGMHQVNMEWDDQKNLVSLRIDGVDGRRIRQATVKVPGEATGSQRTTVLRPTPNNFEPGSIYPIPDAAEALAPQFKSEADLVAILDAPLRKRAAERAEKMKEFEINYQKMDRNPIDVDDSNPESLKHYHEEMARREKEDAQREQQYSGDFQRNFSDVYTLCGEIVQRCVAKDIKIDTVNACGPFIQPPTRTSSVTAMTVAGALEGLARKCLN